VNASDSASRVTARVKLMIPKGNSSIRYASAFQVVGSPRVLRRRGQGRSGSPGSEKGRTLAPSRLIASSLSKRATNNQPATVRARISSPMPMNDRLTPTERPVTRSRKYVVPRGKASSR
jgi:hypothetical protein